MRLFYFFLIAAFVNSCYVLGTERVFNAVFIDHFWTALFMGILFISYFILSLNPRNYWRGKQKWAMQQAKDRLAKATDFKTRIAETRKKEREEIERVKEELTEKRKNRGKTLKSKYKKA